MTLEERIDRLEKSARTWRWSAIALASAIVVALAWSMASPSDPLETFRKTGVLQAKRILLRNHESRIVGDWSAGESGSRVFVGGCYISGDHDRGSISLKNDKSRLSLGPTQISLGSYVTSPHPEWSSPDERVTISFSDTGGFVHVCSPLGKRVVSIQSSKTNSGAVYVYGPNGEMQSSLTGDKR